MSAIRVYPELEIVFVHSPKCAGQTIMKYLEQVTKQMEVYHGEIPKKYQNWWKFSVVRNPFDRFISAWAYLIPYGSIPKETSPLGLIDLAHEYAKQNVPVSPLNWEDIRDLPEVWAHHHVAPLTHEDRCLGNLDYLGRFEQLDDVIQDLRDWYGIKTKGIHENQSQHEPFQSYYDSVLYHKVLDYYSDDFDEFNYPRYLPLT